MIRQTKFEEPPDIGMTSVMGISFEVRYLRNLTVVLIAMLSTVEDSWFTCGLDIVEAQGQAGNTFPQYSSRYQAETNANR